MAISGVLGRENLNRLKVRAEFPEEIYAGVATLASVHLENGGRIWPRFLLQVLLEDADVLVPVLGPGSVARKRHHLVFPARGTRTIRSIVIQSPFPVNFFVRRRSMAVERKITVFPRPAPCLPAGSEGREKSRGERREGRKGYEGEVSRIAEYRGGDPLKLIHWRLSARQDQLLVKELSDPERSPVILDPDRLPGTDLEVRLSCACYWVVRLIREGRMVGLKLGETTFPPGQGRAQKVRLLTALATYGQD